MEYKIPADDRPMFVDWESGVSADGQPMDLRWWLPALLSGYGARIATAVIDSKGEEMTIFRGTDRIGTAAAPYTPAAPRGDDLWILTGTADAPERPEAAHLIRDTGWTVAEADNDFGLAQAADFPDGGARRWQLAYACTLLGFFPPLGLFEGTPEEFTAGVRVLEERPARRVKRALIERLALERQESRDLSTRIEANWRLS